MRTNPKLQDSRFKILLFIFLFSLPWFLFTGFVFALTQTDFQKDMAYYYRTAKSQNLTPNDRLHILDRLRQKYRDVEFDLSELYAEINRWTTEKIKEQKSSPKPKKSLPAETQKKIGVISSILVTESENATRLRIEGQGLKKYKEVFQKDEKGIQPPVLVLYLYQTLEKLAPNSKNFVVRSGAIRQVQTKQISFHPPTVQLSISFRDHLPYTLEAQENQLLLTIAKKEPKEISQVQETLLPSSPIVPTPTPDLSREESDVKIATSITTYYSPQYILKPGDFLEIKLKPLELSRRHMIEEDGTIEFHPGGKLHFAGHSISEAEKMLHASLSQFLQVEDVKIALQMPGAGQVLLVGQVQSPGSYLLEKPLRCFELISKSGGFLPDADKKNILIYRLAGVKPITLPFDIEEFLTTANPEKDLILQAGDKIEVPRVKDSVFIFGAVKNQGFVPYKPGLKLMSAIALAGGIDSQREGGKIRILRKGKGEKNSLEIDLRRQLRKNPQEDILLKPDDFILVSEKKSKQGENFKTVLLPWGIFLTSLGVILALLF